MDSQLPFVPVEKWNRRASLLCYLGSLIASDILRALASNVQILSNEEPKITSFDDNKCYKLCGNGEKFHG